VQGSATFRAAARLSGIGLSPIARMGELAAELSRRGTAVIGLQAGEPDFPTPPHVLEAAEAAMRAGDTHYPTTGGTAALKAAIAGKLARENDAPYAPGELLVANGAKQVIFNAFVATLEAGDEVILPAPYWTSYPDMIRLCGGTPTIVPCPESEGFLLTPEALAAAAGPRSRWLLLNAPGNPTGAVYDETRLLALLAAALEIPGLLVMVDEIYEHLLYDGRRFASAARLAAGPLPPLRERLLVVNGVSKAYAMTGWRIGYGAGPAPLIAAMTAVQSQSTSGACSIAQAAAVAALAGPQEGVAERRRSFERRRDLLLSLLEPIGGLTCQAPAGAFYLLPSCAGLLGRRTAGGRRLDGDGALAEALLEEAAVAVVPGSAFGAPGHLRLSYACDEADLREACRRIAGFVSALA